MSKNVYVKFDSSLLAEVISVIKDNKGNGNLGGSTKIYNPNGHAITLINTQDKVPNSNVTYSACFYLIVGFGGRV